MRWWLLALGLLACTGDPVGEAAATGGSAGAAATSGSAGTSGQSGAAGSGGGVAGSGGSSGSGGSGGSAGGITSGVLDPDSAGAEGIAVDDTYVYYGKSGSVWRVEKTGGTPVPIADAVTHVREVAVDDQNVYFLESNKIIRRAPKAGGVPTLLVQGAGSFEKFGDIATDGAWVYYSSVDDTTSYSGAIRRVKVTGGVPETIQIVQHAAEPFGVYLYKGEIYWANHLSGELYKEEVAGDQPTLLGTGANKPRKLAANDTHVFWTETDGSLGFKSFGGIYMVVEASGPGEDVVIDDSHVFFSAPTIGRVYATSIVPDTAAVVAECNLPGALAIDALAVYVACAGTPGSVLKIAK